MTTENVLGALFFGGASFAALSYAYSQKAAAHWFDIFVAVVSASVSAKYIVNITTAMGWL